MAGFAEQVRSGRVGTFFVVLPDSDAASMAARRIQAIASQACAHASGRPWLAGRWADDEFSLAQDGGQRVALIGSFGPDAGPASPGSFHVVVSSGGLTQVKGTASGARLVFHASIGGVAVAASRADVLAWLSGSSLDETQVAVRLLEVMPHPLPLTPLWRGVRAVEPGHSLELTSGGAARQKRWWPAPIADRPLATHAGSVRSALIDAVGARTAAGGTVTCDLSGGMDSTAICFLAATGPAKVIARTMAGADPAGTDLTWARRAAAHLPEVEHVVVAAQDDWPLRYADLAGYDDVMDEPAMSVMGRAELARFYFPLADRGARVHLTGLGGDHVTWCGPSHYHDLLTRRPALAVRRLRGYRALHHWPLGETVRALADRRPYHRWLTSVADNLRAPAPKLEWTLGWSAQPRLPHWVTPDAAAAVRKVIKEAASTARPLSPARGMHVELAAIHHGGRWLRTLEQTCARAGLRTASPFFDDAMVEACLSICPQDRVTPWRYRPVLHAALNGIVPEECLRRSTKDVFSLPASRSLARHRADLLALWEDSRLAGMGVVDEKLLRAAISSSMTDAERNPLDTAISVEVWLRTLADPLRD